MDGSYLRKVELDENIVTLKLPEWLKACAELGDGVWRGHVRFGWGKRVINERAAVEEGVEAEVSRVVKVTLAGLGMKECLTLT